MSELIGENIFNLTMPLIGSLVSETTNRKADLFAISLSAEMCHEIIQVIVPGISRCVFCGTPPVTTDPDIKE